MKKMYKAKNTSLLYKIMPYFLLIVVCSLSVAYAAFGSEINITGTVATVVMKQDIRVTGVSVESETDSIINNGGTSSYAEYTDSSISTGITLPNDNSSVTYNVEITNLGNVESGLLEITGLPNNLDYEIVSDYNLKDKICDDNGSCKLGIKKNIQVQIKYKENGYDSSNTYYDVTGKFNFQPFYEVTYNGIDIPSELEKICTLVNDTDGIISAGDKYSCKVDPNNGAYDFYVLSLDGDYANLIMSANMRPDGTPVIDSSLVSGSAVAWNLSGNALEGPLTAMEYLNTATSNWIVPNLNEKYTDSNYGKISLTGKARLPYASEVSDLSYSSGNAYLYDNVEWTQEASSEYFPEGMNSVSGVMGYWTMESTSPEMAAFVNADGMFTGQSYYINMELWGIRPVISLNTVTNSSYPSEILGTETLVVNFGEDAPEDLKILMANAEISNYTYSGGILTVPNVSGNVEIGLGDWRIANYIIKGNSVQNGTPTPDSPIEIMSVGNKSKNLFDESLLLELSSITKTEEGYVNASYPANYGASNKLVKHLKSVLKPGVTYTLSRETVGYLGNSEGSISIRNSSGAIVSVRFGEGLYSTTFSLTQEQIDSISNVYIYGSRNGTIIYKYIQLEEGSSATAYKPYGYEIPIKVTGKNVYNAEEIIYNLENNLLDTTSYTTSYIQLKPNTTYYMKVFNPITASGYLFISNNSQVNSGTTGTISPLDETDRPYPRGNEKTTTTDSSGRIYFGSSSMGGIENMKKVLRDCQLMIVEGSYTAETVPDYEPYNEYISTSIYLDEPLRKVGDYYDYIDYASGTVVRQVGYSEFFNNNYTIQNTDLGNTYYRNGYFSTSGETQMLRGTGLTGYSNILPANNGGWTTPKSENIRFGQNNTVFYIYTKNIYATKDDLYNYLSNNGTIVPYVIYPLETPSTTNISLPKIKINSNSVVTIGTDIQPSEIIIN